MLSAVYFAGVLATNIVGHFLIDRDGEWVLTIAVYSAVWFVSVPILLLVWGIGSGLETLKKSV